MRGALAAIVRFRGRALRIPARRCCWRVQPTSLSPPSYSNSTRGLITEFLFMFWN